MDVRWLDVFSFSEKISEFFPKMIEELVKSPILDSSKINFPPIFEAELESQSGWKETVSSCGSFLFGRLPQDHTQRPDIAFPTPDVRVSRRTGWLLYLPLEEIATFIKHKKNNNTIYVNDHSCNFSLLQDSAVVAFPKDKAHSVAFHSRYANSYSYEEIAYLFANQKETKIICTEPLPEQSLMYNIIGNLGKGLSGKTYIAFDHSGDRIVTIKKYFSNIQSLPEKETLLQNLFHDYRLLQIERQTFLHPENQKIANVSQSLDELASIGHLNVSQVLRIHFLQAQNQTFLCRVNEYTPSISLKQYITLMFQEKKSLPLHIFKNIIYQLLVALEYLHSRGIVHGALSPEKIILVPYSYGTLIKIRDYPLNEKLSDFEMEVNEKRKRGNHFHFIAPELTETDRNTPPADIFSLALICYYMLTDTILHSDIKKFDELPLRYDVLSMKDEIQEKLAKNGLKESLITIILQCLHKNPKERPSLHEIFEELIRG